MAKYYAPNFSGLLPLFDGKSAAGGKLYAYRAGSSIPAPLFDEDGVELGSWVSIDSNGCADFLLDSALSYKLIAKDALGAVVGEWDNVKATNAPGGMDNPMTAPGDLIVGGTGGGGGGGAPAIIEPFKIANCTGTANDAGCAVMQFAPYKFTPTALTYYVNAYTGSTRKIKGVVYNSSGKVVYSSAELPLVNKMNTIPLSKVTTYEDKAYFTPGELFFIGVAISSGDSSYQWWTMSSSWYKSFVMSYPPPDTKSSTNQNTIHWMSLTVTPLS